MLTRLLAEDGFDMVPLRQGFASLSAPSKLFEKLVAEGKLRHPAHPVLDWNVDNTVIELDAAGNIKPSKAKSTEKIDGTLALVNALDSYSRTPMETSYEIYVV
jgi:phage terminase large subunit-like protein